MPAPTYDLISEQTLSNTAATVTFSSIPGAYKDLVLECVTSNSTGTTAIQFQVNSDTGSNYSRTILYGDGTNAASTRDLSQTSGAIGLSSTDQSTTFFHFMSYANTNVNKTVIARGGSAGSQTRAGVSLWRSTSAITSIVLALGSGSFASGCTFRLWGVAG